MRWIGTSVIGMLLLVPAAGLKAQELDRAQGMGATDTGAADAGALDAGASADDARRRILAWTPPALEVLGQRAEVRNSFVLDRNALRAVQAFTPESDDGVRPAIRKLDGIGVHLYRFRAAGLIDEASLAEVRQAYRARGWKHLVSEGGAADSGHKKTDLWLILDGMNVRGGAMMLVTPKSVSLITFAGDLNPVDVLHLRGHFGIPAAGDDFLRKTR